MQVSRSSLIPGESARFPVRTNAESIPAPIVAGFAEYALKSVSRATACLFKASAACSMVGRRPRGQASWVDRLPVMCCRFGRPRDQGDGAPRRRVGAGCGPAGLAGPDAPASRAQGCQPDQYGIGTWVQMRASQDHCCRTNPVQALGSGVSGDPDRRDRDEGADEAGNRPVCGSPR